MSKSVSHAASTLDLYHPGGWGPWGDIASDTDFDEHHFKFPIVHFFLFLVLRTAIHVVRIILLFSIHHFQFTMVQCFFFRKFIFFVGFDRRTESIGSSRNFMTPETFSTCNYIHGHLYFCSSQVYRITKKFYFHYLFTRNCAKDSHTCSCGGVKGLWFFFLPSFFSLF